MAIGGQKLNFEKTFAQKSHLALANGSVYSIWKKLAGTYSTLETRTITKFKMAAAAVITANYEIGHNLKRIQVRDPFF